MGLDRAQNFFGEDFVAGDGDGGDDGVLPGIEAVDFCNGDVEAVAEAVFQTLDDVALLFERMRSFYDDVESEYTDDGH